MKQNDISARQGHPQEVGGGLQYCILPHSGRILKNTDFYGKMISNVLLDLPFSRNQPLKRLVT